MEPHGQGLFNSFLSSVSSDEKRVRFIAAIGLIGILLIFAGGMKKNETAPKKGGDSSAQFVSDTEEQLEKMLSQVSNVGRVEVLITLESGRQSVYAVNEKQSDEAVATYANGEISKSEQTGDTEQSYLLVDTGGGKAPLEITSSEPTVRGVLVVCDGAKSAMVKKSVIDAVTTTLGVGANQVCVLEYKS